MENKGMTFGKLDVSAALCYDGRDTCGWFRRVYFYAAQPLQNVTVRGGALREERTETCAKALQI